MVTFIPKVFGGKSHLLNDTERERQQAGDTEGENGSFGIVKINKHVWAYSWQHETTQ